MHTFLRTIYTLSNIGLSIAIPFLLWNMPKYQVFFGEQDMGFIASTYFVVCIFIFLMQIVLAPYIPKNKLQLAWISLSPLLWAAMYSLLLYSHPATVLLYAGYIYMSSLLLSFIVLVVFAPLYTGAWKDWDPKTFLGYFTISAAQLIFIIPAIGAIYIFGRVIFLADIAPLFHSSPWVVFFMTLWHLAIISIEMFSFLPKLAEESIFGGKV